MSSTEASGAVNLLASLGYIEPIVQGAPAEWAANVVPSDVASIADHLRQDVPALPVYEPVFAEQAALSKSGRQQAGRGRGRK
jgi:ketosteroid isomerase-like protein